MTTRDYAIAALTFEALDRTSDAGKGLARTKVAERVGHGQFDMVVDLTWSRTGGSAGVASDPRVACVRRACYRALKGHDR